MSDSRERASKQRRLSAMERRIVLLDAALPLFANRGYEATSVSDLAAAAGVTKPVLYEHFGSKQELYVALVGREASRISDAILARFDIKEPLEARLRSLGLEAVGFARGQPDAVRLLLQLPVGDTEVLAAHERARTGARRLVAAGILADPLFHPSPGMSREIAAALLADLHTAVLERLVNWAIEHPEIPADVLGQIFLDVLWDGLSGSD